jgi:hypothetical protein
MPESPPTRCTSCGKFLYHGEKCSDCNWTGSRYNRGPAKINDPRWRALRKQRLALNPFCCECGLIATEVDHLDGTDYQDDSGVGRSWLSITMTRSMCTDCHHSRTGRQGAAAKQSRDYGT